jgi:hypothetical protein
MVLHPSADQATHPKRRQPLVQWVPNFVTKRNRKGACPASVSIIETDNGIASTAKVLAT